ncbi:hypothetical protein HMPREF9621_02803 [Cutibacterium modestum HL037PA2]|uniref:Uncharacterized protein n=1 Tax=Cutibacterium modestum HL044PA1 TaxID=765109 RepID=A0ABP2KAF3_9ACTN|nr:hypothetical protein HMPREF9621_02803 [Cutibacterium modestum HL037PA2]EFS92989.1 hypothetical protein HMPREF9607_00840 [Cutibacterium modestum HL044PA1]
MRHVFRYGSYLGQEDLTNPSRMVVLPEKDGAYRASSSVM